MDLLTFLWDFTEYFMTGNYKRGIHLLTKYDKNDIANVTIKKCHEISPDDALGKCQSFLHWMIQQNITVSELMMHLVFIKKKDTNYEALGNKFILQIMELHSLPPIKQHLSVEFIVLHNYLISVIYNNSVHISADGVWKLITSSFRRAQEVLKPSKRKNYQLYQFAQNISLLSNIFVTSMTKLEKDALYYLCFAIGWFSAYQEDYSIVSAITKAMINLKKVHKSYNLLEARNHLKLFCSTEISSISSFLANDAHGLLVVCLAVKQKNYDSALQYLNKISIPEWNYNLLYTKAFIYYKRSMFTMATECCIKFWNEQENCEDELSSRFCNLLGCCYFMQNEIVQSQKWFQIAMDRDDSFFLPVFNLSLVLLYLNKAPEATRILKYLSEKLQQITSYPCLVFQHFFMKYHPDLMSIEIDYYLAHHYVNLEYYVDAAFIFERLLLFLQENKMQIFSTYNYERIPHFFCLLYIEGAYAFLQSGFYDKCIQTCGNIQRIIPFSLSENALISDWILDVIPSLIYEKRLSTQFNNSPDVLAENKEDSVLIRSEEKSQAMGNYFRNKEALSIISDEEKILQNKLLCVIAHFIKAVAEYKTANIREAVNVMKRACDFGLDLLQSKALLFKSKRQDQVTESESANKQKENLSMEPVMLTHTVEELINDANSSTDEGTPSYNGDNYHLTVSEKLPADSENNSEEFQIYQSNGDCATGHILCNSDEIALLSQIYNNMAIFCIVTDQLKNAEHYLKVAAECMPDNIDVLYNCCLLELKNGNFDVAQNMWENGKQKISIINGVLAGEISTFPHSVTFEQIETLNDIFNVENNICFTFDVDWSD